MMRLPAAARAFLACAAMLMPALAAGPSTVLVMEPARAYSNAPVTPRCAAPYVHGVPRKRLVLVPHICAG